MGKALLATIAALAVAGFAWAAGLPRSEKEVLVYQGAARDSAAEKERQREEEGSEGAGGTLGEGVKSRSLRIFRSGASIDEVFEFYRKALSAKAGAEESNPMSLGPGKSLPALYSIYLHAGDAFQDQRDTDGTLVYPGKALKASFDKDGRKPFRGGQYLSEVQFTWAVREGKGDIAALFVTLVDDSIREKEDPKSGQVSWHYQRGTRIEVGQVTYLPEKGYAEKREAEQDAEMDRVQSARVKEFKARPPTEKDLGVPPYPGARFDADISAGMTMDNDMRMWVFFSDDPPDKVLAFYEQKIGKRAMSWETGKHMIALKGQSALPEHGVSVETLEGNPLFKGKGKTVITVARTVGKE